MRRSTFAAPERTWQAMTTVSRGTPAIIFVRSGVSKCFFGMAGCTPQFCRASDRRQPRHRPPHRRGGHSQWDAGSRSGSTRSAAPAIGARGPRSKNCRARCNRRRRAIRSVRRPHARHSHPSAMPRRRPGTMLPRRAAQRVSHEKRGPGTTGPTASARALVLEAIRCSNTHPCRAAHG